MGLVLFFSVRGLTSCSRCNRAGVVQGVRQDNLSIDVFPFLSSFSFGQFHSTRAKRAREKTRKASTVKYPLNQYGHLVITELVFLVPDRYSFFEVNPLDTYTPSIKTLVMAPSVSVLTETGFHSIVSFPLPHPLVLSVNKSPADVTLYFHKRAQGIGTQRQFSENVCSEDDL